jgi:hypothetical protein
MENEPQPAPSAPALSAPVFWICFLVIAAVGIALRVEDTATYRRTGFDEFIYRRYVYGMDGGKQRFSIPKSDKTLANFEATINGTGMGATPALSELFIKTQRDPNVKCELPPTRFLFIYTAWVWKNLRWGETPPVPLNEMMTESAKKPADEPYSKDCSRRDPAIASLNEVSFAFSVLMMIAGGLFAWRMLGRAAGLGVLALMGADPLQIHISQHAMVDGFFAFWALLCLWTTWECLRSPTNRYWLAGHTVCLALMVMTKENAFFAYCALALIVISNRWLRFGTVTPVFIGLSMAGPLIGVAMLVMVAGGVGNFIEIYKLLVNKAQGLDYAFLTGDGPWFRYLVDLIAISPIVLCLALGALFALTGRRKEVAFLAIFVAASWAIMCNVRYGMNLRYTSMWGMPMRAAAFLMLWELCARFGKRQWLVALTLITGLCAYDVRQYGIFGRNPDDPWYETYPKDMQHRLKIVKDDTDLPKTPASIPAPSTPSSPRP